MPAPIFTPGKGPVGPIDFDFAPPDPGPLYVISGVTRDSTNAPLGGCQVMLFRTRDDILVDETVSDGSGNYRFTAPSPVETYYVIAYEAGSPDVAGTTVNTLVAFGA